MTSLLVRDAAVLVSHDTRRRAIAGGGLFATDGMITRVGPTTEPPTTAGVLDLTDHNETHNWIGRRR